MPMIAEIIYKAMIAYAYLALVITAMIAIIIAIAAVPATLDYLWSTGRKREAIALVLLLYLIVEILASYTS